jgi:hypothetical protein
VFRPLHPSLKSYYASELSYLASACVESIGASVWLQKTGDVEAVIRAQNRAADLAIRAGHAARLLYPQVRGREE